jgi:hypothetical protein
MLYNEYPTNCVEGIVTSKSMIDQVYPKIYESCVNISLNYESERDIYNYYIQSLLYAWSFVDSFNRIRELLKFFPLLSKKDKELKVFLSKTEKIKYFRNYHQHLSRENNNPDNFSNPVWGNLSWVNPNNENECIIAITNSNSNNRTYYGLTFDTYENKWMSKSSLNFGDNSIHFDKCYEELELYLQKFYSWMASTPDISIIEEFKMTLFRQGIEKK